MLSFWLQLTWRNSALCPAACTGHLHEPVLLRHWSAAAGHADSYYPVWRPRVHDHAADVGTVGHLLCHRCRRAGVAPDHQRHPECRAPGALWALLCSVNVAVQLRTRASGSCLYFELRFTFQWLCAHHGCFVFF